MEQKWILLDMHMHSDYSKYKDNSRVTEMDAKSFVDVMIKNRISLFSITDHNRFNSKLYDEIDKYIRDNNLKLKIINGVECDIKVTIEDGTEDIVHMCLYFEDRINRANLEDSLENLYFDSGKLKKVDFSELLNVIFDLKARFIIIPHGNKDRGLFNKNLIKKLSLGEREEFHKYAMYKIFNAYDINPSFYDKNSDKYWASNFFEKSKEYNNLMPTDDEANEVDIQQIFAGDGVSLAFTFDQEALGITSVTVANVIVDNYNLDRETNQIVFTEAPDAGANIIVIYQITNSWKDMSKAENRLKVQENIIRIGKNQVAQIIWKLQLGGLEQLNGLR